MKAPSTKQAAEESASEKGLFTTRALPVREPEGEEKIKDEGQGKQHGGNNEQASQLHHGAEEEQEHNEAQSAISCPLSYIVRTRSGNFRRGRIFHLNSGPLIGMGFGEKGKFPFSNDKAFAEAGFWADLSIITEEVSPMATTKEINKFDYVKEGVRYTIHVEGADGGVMWGTWNCHNCNVGGSSKKSATSITDAAEAAKSDLEHHHIANHSV